jgi:uncharacterized repeat protein (TIGR01451 family)
VTCSRSTALEFGDSASVAITVQVSTALPLEPITNAACVRTSDDVHTANDCSSVTTPTAVRRVATLRKEALGPVIVGQTGRFRIWVTNTGSAPLTGPIVVMDSLLRGMTYTTAGGEGWSCTYMQSMVHCTGALEDHQMPANAAYDKLLAERTRDEVMAIVTETRVNYVDQFKQLLSKITVPKILFWYSNRKPAYTEGFENANALYCGMPSKVPFPELVNQEMIDALTGEADEYVECITERGKPHKLVSRFTGLPVTISDRGRVISENVHYPSPEMHQDAALLLEPVCRKLLSR